MKLEVGQDVWMVNPNDRATVKSQVKIIDEEGQSITVPMTIIREGVGSMEVDMSFDFKDVFTSREDALEELKKVLNF